MCYIVWCQNIRLWGHSIQVRGQPQPSLHPNIFWCLFCVSLQNYKLLQLMPKIISFSDEIILDLTLSHKGMVHLTHNIHLCNP